MTDFDCFCQFTGHTVDFTIQWLTLWPHSKWRNECYYDNYVFLERVYFGVFIWYCDYDVVMMSVSVYIIHPTPKYFGVFI